MSTRKSREQRETAERHAWCQKRAEELKAEASRKRINREKDRLLQQMLLKDEREQARKQAEAEFQRVKPAIQSPSRRKK